METPPKTTILLFVLLIFLVQATTSTQQRLLQTTTYVTTQPRGLTVTNHCTDRINRQQLYQQYGLDGDIPHSQSVTNAFNMNTDFIDAAVDGKWSEFGDKLRGNAGEMFAFVGAWVIGLGIAIILLPFLLCCCCCPWSCPPWCGRKRENMPYTKCEMVWPAIVSLILLLIILVTAIVGISSKFKALAVYEDTACVTGVLLDDVTNGNVSFTDPMKYFTGVRTIDTKLREMNSKITTLNTQIAKLGTASTGMIDATAKLAISKGSTSVIPSLSESSLALTYPTPLQNTPGSTTSAIPSIFPSILGNKTSTSTLVGIAYLSLTGYQTTLQTIATTADTYTANSASFMTSINQALNETDKYATDLQNQDSKANDFWNQNDGVFKAINTGQYVYYGVLIGLVVVMILAVGCTVWGMSGKCRNFMYAVCGVLFVACIVAFLFCIFVSVLNPILYYSCQYVQENLSSQAKLKDTLQTKFDLDPNVAGNISDCIAIDGSGDLAENILGTAVYTTIQSLNTTYINLVNIDTTYVNYINLTHQAVLTNVTSFKQAQVRDIVDQTSLSLLIKLSKADNYACTATGFKEDSWIPAIKQYQTYVTCGVSSGLVANSTSCSSSAGFSARASGCVGCMDTYDLFKTNGTYANVKAALDSRYADSTCTTFTTQLSNVWANFYKQKIDKIGPVESRSITAQTNANTVQSTVDYFLEVKSNIDSNFSSIVNSQYGLLQGLNCQVTGQDIRLMKNVVCRGLFLYTYFARIIFGILSFALLLLMCCVACVGHRNFKQMDGAGKYDDSGSSGKKDREPLSPTFNQNNLPSEQQFMYQNNNQSMQQHQPNPYYQPTNPNHPYAPPNKYSYNPYPAV